MNIGIIFAGGIGSRMKMPGMPKQFLKVNGVPIIVHTLRHFQIHPDIHKIVVVILEDYMDYMRQLAEEYHLTKVESIVAGGATGQESIYNGLKAAERIADNKNAIVLIHDGVRPIIEEGLIDKNIASVKEYGSAISSVPCKETIIQLEDNNYVKQVIDRSTVWLARAPQSFYLNEILTAHERARSENQINVIDSCTMMTQYGKKCHIVETCSENLKVTTPDDFFIVERLMNVKKIED